MTKQQTAEILKLSSQEANVKESYEKKDETIHTVDDIKPDYELDSNLTEFGKATLLDRYLLPGEKFQDMFVRVAKKYSDNYEHGQRIYKYMSNLWFMPATPVLSNGGAKRGLPISCFLNSVGDSLDGILSKWGENVWLASNGGGIGTYWGNVRSIGEEVKGNGQTSGIIPFVRVMDSLTLAISQGALRRGSAACYLDVHHPEIEEFLEIRKPSGDFNRKSLNVHHGINITDEFMDCVKMNKDFSLRSPKTKKVLKKVNARELWQKILETRMATGEPYLVFVDTVNRSMSKHQRDSGLKVTTSNLCSEIMLHTGLDHKGKERTAVCCLSSVNLEKWEEWNTESKFIEDIMRFLDNVLQDFINRAPQSMANAVYSAIRERSVGLGAMGFHSFLQKNNISFESAIAKSWNLKFFKHIRKEADKASLILAMEKGACPDASEKNIKARFSHKLAIAPTASISIICGGTSACIEPIPANVYTHKTLSGSFTVKNKYLEKILEEKKINNNKTWQSILENEGSVSHIKELSQDERNCFKTAFEIDQRWIIEFASDRTPFICQGQSINLFLPSDIDKWDLMMLHWKAWETGVKSLYYCRSKSIQRASYAGVEADNTKEWPQKSLKSSEKIDYDECLSCQ